MQVPNPNRVSDDLAWAFTTHSAKKRQHAILERVVQLLVERKMSIHVDPARGQETLDSISYVLTTLTALNQVDLAHVQANVPRGVEISGAANQVVVRIRRLPMRYWAAWQIATLTLGALFLVYLLVF